MSIARKVSRSRFASVSWLCMWISLGCCGSLSAQPAAAEHDWPQFLGPHRNGLSDETGLIDNFSAQGPKVLWRVPGGVGMSGVSVSRGRVLTMVQSDGKQWLVALDSESGKEIWRTAIAPEYRNPMGDGPRATPTIAGDRVFVFTGEGVLAAVNFQDGKLLWSSKPLSVHSGKEAEYGMACSPLVIGDLVVVTVGAPEATLVAYDIRSGQERWNAGNDPAGYSSPTVLKVGGQSQIVSFTGDSAIGIDIQKGTILWRYPFETNYQCNIATPIAIKDQVFLSAGENHGSVLLALKPKADQFEVEPVWSSFGPSSVMRNEWQTSLLIDGYLYGMDNVGGAGPITHLKCIQADTGKMAWQQLRFGKGNLIAADGKLWITTMKGDLVLVKASPDRFEELGRTTLLQSTRQIPALSQGRMYLRDDAEIVCVDVRKR